MAREPTPPCVVQWLPSCLTRPWLTDLLVKRRQQPGSNAKPPCQKGKAGSGKSILAKEWQDGSVSKHPCQKEKAGSISLLKGAVWADITPL